MASGQLPIGPQPKPSLNASPNLAGQAGPIRSRTAMGGRDGPWWAVPPQAFLRPDHMQTTYPQGPAICTACVWVVGAALGWPASHCQVSGPGLELSAATDPTVYQSVFQTQLRHSGTLHLPPTTPKTEASKQTTSPGSPEHRCQAQGWFSLGLAKWPLGRGLGPANPEKLPRHNSEQDPRRMLHRGRSNVRILQMYKIHISVHVCGAISSQDGGRQPAGASQGHAGQGPQASCSPRQTRSHPATPPGTSPGPGSTEG